MESNNEKVRVTGEWQNRAEKVESNDDKKESWKKREERKWKNELYIYIYIYICVCVCVCVCVFVCVCVYMFIYISIKTNIFQYLINFQYDTFMYVYM